MQVLDKPPSHMRLAYKTACTSDYGKFRVGAVITSGNRIVSLGTNSKKSHPLQAKFARRPHLHAWRHAEVHGISLSRVEDLHGADIYVARSLKNGEYGNSRPCSGCYEALKFFGIRRMYFYEDGAFVRELVQC